MGITESYFKDAKMELSKSLSAVLVDTIRVQYKVIAKQPLLTNGKDAKALGPMVTVPYDRRCVAPWTDVPEFMHKKVFAAFQEGIAKGNSFDFDNAVTLELDERDRQVGDEYYHVKLNLQTMTGTWQVSTPFPKKNCNIKAYIRIFVERVKTDRIIKLLNQTNTLRSLSGKQFQVLTDLIEEYKGFIKNSVFPFMNKVPTPSLKMRYVTCNMDEAETLQFLTAIQNHISRIQQGARVDCLSF
jgi:hypothetical protein